MIGGAGFCPSTVSQATFPTAPWTFAPPKLWVLKSWTSPRRISGCLEFERNRIQSQTRPKITRKTRVRWVCVGFSLWYRDWSILHQHLFGKSQGFWSTKSWRLLLEFFPWILKPTKKPAVRMNWSDQWFHRNFTPEVEQQVYFWFQGTVGRSRRSYRFLPKDA